MKAQVNFDSLGGGGLQLEIMEETSPYNITQTLQFPITPQEFVFLKNSTSGRSNGDTYYNVNTGETVHYSGSWNTFSISGDTLTWNGTGQTGGENFIIYIG